MPDGQPVQRLGESAAAIHPRLWPDLWPLRTQGNVHGAGRPRSRAKEFGEEITAPAQDEEFVLYHSDNVEASGFVQHLKLPHYVDFQGELVTVRELRKEIEAREKAERINNDQLTAAE